MRHLNLFKKMLHTNKSKYSFENGFDPLFCEIGSVDRRHSLCSPRGQFYIMYLFW